MSSRNTIPVLGFAQVAKSADGVTFTVTNLDESLAYTLPPETQAPGTGAGVFLCSVEELKKEDTITQVPIGEESVRITITTGGQRSRYRPLPAFPAPIPAGLLIWRGPLSASSPDEYRVQFA